MHSPQLLFLLAVCVMTTGCTTLTPPIGEIFALKSDQFADADKTPEAGPSPDVPSFLVELRGTNNESQKFKRPLTDDATYVQGVLEQSNALKHFGRVKIELWRRQSDGQGYHKLDVPYDRKSRMVRPEFDYAIHEGDRLVFMKDDSSILDDMLGSLGI